MSVIAASISLEEYLATSYEPDREYINGHLKQKAVTGFRHGVTQGLLFLWFHERRREWAILASLETRTEVSQDRVRLPDVVIVRKGEEAEGALTKPPLVAIEVLSPTDSYSDLRERATDLRAMGTENIWLLDPLRRTGTLDRETVGGRGGKGSARGKRASFPRSRLALGKHGRVNSLLRS